MRTLDMRELDCLYFNTYAAMQQAARSIRAAGYPVYESDVNPLQRYLMERMVSGSMRVTGNRERFGGFTGFRNPKLRGCEYVPDLRVMSVSVAPDGKSGAATAAACVEEGRERVFVVDGRRGIDAGGGDDKIRYCRDERSLLAELMDYIVRRDPDVLTGFDVIDAALHTLQERCGALGLRFEVGREAGSRVSVSTRGLPRRDGYVPRGPAFSARVPGRVAMDLGVMLRAYGRGGADENVGRRAAAPADSGSDGESGAAACLAAAKDAFEAFVDAEVLPNALERSRRSGQPLDGVGGSVASFDHLYLPRLHRAGFAAGDTADIRPPAKALPGGYVLEPAPGLYENVLVFDFKSLYPSIIMTFMIDPLGFRVPGGERIATPVGTTFSRSVSIMPEIIRELLAARAAAVRLKNPYLSQAIKLLMNSFAGVLASTGCRFFSEEVSPSITLTGQHILKTTIGHIEETCGKKVIYGDTDSIFVDLGPGGENGAAALGARVSKETGAWLREKLMEQYGAESALELKYEEHYRRFFIPPLRGGAAGQGTKKHYCGAVEKPDGQMELTFKGMESARSDWTDLAKEFQRELFLMFFSGKPLEGYIAGTVERLRRGEFDDKLIYRKRVRKELDAYTSNIPPHVQAAKQLDAPVRAVSYYITKNGPQPLEKLSAPIDYEHYADSQLRPVADSILLWMGSDFDDVVSGQTELF
jgi:DNA polymerase-2